MDWQKATTRAWFPALLVTALVLVACPAQQRTQGSPEASVEATDEATEAPEPTAEAETSVLGLDAGDCFNLIDEDDKTAERVDCDEEHQYEVYAVVEVGDDEWPGDDELAEVAADCYGDVFEDFVGLEYAFSRWYATPFLPTEGDWDEGLEGVICALYDPDEPETTGSAEGTEEDVEPPAEETGEPQETGAGQDLNDDEAQLLAAIPQEFRGTCEPLRTFGMLDSIATMDCYPAEGARPVGTAPADRVLYGLYADAETMYDIFVNDIDDADDFTDGSCPDDPPSLTTYERNDEKLGEYICLAAGDPYPYANLQFTYDALLILGDAQREDGDLAALREWWGTGAALPEE